MFYETWQYMGNTVKDHESNPAFGERYFIQGPANVVVAIRW